MEAEKPKDQLEKAISYLPLLTLLVLGFGVMKQYFYYYYFNINIFEFVDLTDLLPQTIFDLFFAFVVLVLATIFIGVSAGSHFFEIGEIGVNTPLFSLLNSKKVPYQNERHKLADIFIIFSALFALLMTAILYRYLIDQNTVITQTMVFYVLLSYTIFMLIYLTAPRLIKKSLALRATIPLSFILLFSGIFEGNFKFNKVYLFHTHNAYSITIDKTEIRSTNLFYYIGKTKTDVFFYNVKTNLTTVYPTSAITKMNIGND